MNRNMKQWVAEQISRRDKQPMPLLSFPCCSLMGITVRELISSAQKQAEGMALIARRTNSAAAVSMMDLSVEAEAFGARIRAEDYEVPTVVGSIVNDMDDAEALALPHVGAGRTGIYVEAVRLAAETITDRPVLAGIIGPFSLAGRLMDVTEALVNCYADPDLVHTTMHKATDFLLEYAAAFKAAGADGIVVAEPLAGLLSPELMEEFARPYMKELCSLGDDSFIIVYHNCGNEVGRLKEQIYTLGADVYHFGNAADMADMLSAAPADALVMGNVDPVAQFVNGTPHSMEEAVETLSQSCGGFANFVVSSGCDIPPTASWENIDAFYAAAARLWGADRA